MPERIISGKPAEIAMKRILIILSAVFLFTNCEKKFDNLIDPDIAEYSFKGLTSPDKVNYKADSTITPAINITNLSSGAKVWFDICYLPTGNIINSEVLMKDDGSTASDGDLTANDNIYSGKFTFTSANATGNYEFTYCVKDVDVNGNEIQAILAIKTIYFYGAKDNVASVITNVSVPDTVIAGTTIKVSAAVSDGNGLEDISGVVAKLYTPDGLLYQVLNLYDDGSMNILDTNTGETSGDLLATDGIYTRKISFNSLIYKGNWTISFQAFDLSNVYSTKITKGFTVK